MKSPHLDRATLLEYLDEVDGVDRAAIAAHLAECATCVTELQELEKAEEALRDGEVLSYINEQETDTDRDWLGEALGRSSRKVLRSEAAETFYATKLRTASVETWEPLILNNPNDCSPELGGRIIRAAEIEVDRQPEQALAMLIVAEFLVFASAEGDEGLILSGDIWKIRSNAYRHLGRYIEAIDAAVIAEKFYSGARVGAFDCGLAQYTRAAALFKMTQYAASREAVRQAQKTLEPYGVTAALVNTRMLSALISIEEGNVAAARGELLQLLPMTRALNDIFHEACVRSNLAECSLRLGELDEAVAQAGTAVALYRQLGDQVEELRAEWTHAMIRLARNEDALPRLFEIAAAFARRAMKTDAGFVKLDITQELLRRGAWEAAATLAREVAQVFLGAGVSVASATALSYLREAIENREATPATVGYVRDYIAADDPAKPFHPPDALTQ